MLSRESSKSILDSLINGLPWILSVLGFSLIVIGFSTSYGELSNFLKTVGNAILVGGVIGAILRVFQYMGIFRQELTKAIFSPDFIMIRNDREEIWKKFTSALYTKKFPEISSELHKSIVEDYLPSRKNYYYEDYRRDCSIDWCKEVENSDQILETKEDSSFMIIPENKSCKINYIFGFTTHKSDTFLQSYQEMIKLEINGTDYLKNYKYNLKNIDNGEYVTSKCTIVLTDKEKYVVKKKTRTIFSLNNDPLWTFSPDNFIHGLTLNIYNEIPDDIIITFRPLATSQKWNDLKPTVLNQKRRNDISQQFKGLLFPKQGYIYLCKPNNQRT